MNIELVFFTYELQDIFSHIILHIIKLFIQI